MFFIIFLFLYLMAGEDFCISCKKDITSIISDTCCETKKHRMCMPCINRISEQKVRSCPECGEGVYYETKWLNCMIFEYMQNDGISFNHLRSIMPKSIFIDPTIDEDKNNALHVLCYNKKVSKENKKVLIKFLIKSYGINPNKTNLIGDTPLSIVTSNNEIELIDTLLENGATLDKSKISGESWFGVNSPMAEAISNGDLLVIQKLKLSGLDYSFEDLEWAYFKKKYEVVKHIINKIDFNPDMQGLYKRTALMWAAEANDLELVRSTLAKGKHNVMLKDSEGKTALDLTKSAEILEILEDEKPKGIMQLIFGK